MLAVCPDLYNISGLNQLLENFETVAMEIAISFSFWNSHSCQEQNVRRNHFAHPDMEENGITVFL